MQRLLDDAKTGIINTIIVKDLSRFGRNYIEVGQYIDYVFPAFGIRFIAIQDNVDTENRDSGTMEMMPIMNVFNEWHAANTSKKIRAVKRQYAKEGIYIASKASYGYLIGEDKKHTPVINEETAPIVRRIFEIYASGISPTTICETLNNEKIPSPAIYTYIKFNLKPNKNVLGIWNPSTIREMLQKIIYIGHLPQLRWTSVSYKNHKRYRTDESEWQIVYNNHEPIISQELWDKVQERRKSVATGRTKIGFTHPLSGFLFCADCGSKMKLCTSIKNKKDRYYMFDCDNHARYGKSYCFSHQISTVAIEKLVIEDIQEMAQKIVLDEKSIREEFICHNAELEDAKIKKNKQELFHKQRRVEELKIIIQTAYEDKIKGKIPEDICIGLIEQYAEEQKTITEEIEALKNQFEETEIKQQNADDFIKAIKKYLNAPQLTREMCYELIDRIIIGGTPSATGKDREINIVYKVDIASVLRHRLKNSPQKP